MKKNKSAKAAKKTVKKPLGNKKNSKPVKKAAKAVNVKRAKPVRKAVKKIKPAKKAVKAVKKAIKKITKPVAKVLKKIKVKPAARVLKKAKAKKAVPVKTAKKIVKPKISKSITVSTKMKETPKKNEFARAVEQTTGKLRYSDKELKEFKEIILSKLDDARKELVNLNAALTNINNGTDDTASTFKILEDGSDTLAKEETGQLAVRQRKYVEQLENALVRIENKTYGICRVTGRLIPKERLRAVPHTTQSIEAKLQQYKES